MTDYYSPPSRDSLYFSSYVLSQIMWILALPGLFLIFFLLYNNAPIFYYIFPTMYILVSPFPWYYYAAKKTNRCLDDMTFQAIFERAKVRLGIAKNIQLFLSTENKTILTNARTPFLHGLMVSELAAKLIVRHSSEGEVVLAYELALLKRDHLWLSYLRNIGTIIYAMVTEGTVAFTFAEPLLPFLYQFPLWILAIVITYPWGIGLIIWYHRKSSAEYEIESIYNMNPHMALFKVFSRQSMSDEGRQFYKDEIESNIEIRKSRTITISLGIPMIISITLSVVVHSIFSLLHALPDFIEFAALLLGGISFSFFVFYYESKGTRGLKKPKFAPKPVPRIDDELSIQVEKLLCMKLKTSDCVLTRPSNIFGDDEELGFILVKIADVKLLLLKDEMDILSDPELISSYVLGSYTERISGISDRVFGLILLWFLIQLCGGIIWLIIVLSPPLFILISWIIFTCALAAIFLFGANAISFRKKTKALITLSNVDKNYIAALKKLAESETVSPQRRKKAQRNLRKTISQPN
jgi:hypothetical protein